MESRKRVIALHLKGHSVIEIHRRLQEQNIYISRQGLHNLLLKFQVNRIVADLPRRRRQQTIAVEMRSVIEEALTNNDEITARGLKSLLAS